jgi:hypothetical protein
MLVGRTMEAAEIDEGTGELRCRLWELITPDGLALEFGPGLRWQIAGAAARRA